MESFQEFWNQVFAIREARWVLTLAGTAIVLLVSFYLFKLVRDMALGSPSAGLGDSGDYLTDFQKLRDEGKLNDEEYARLKKSIPTSGAGGSDLPSTGESVEASSEAPTVNFRPVNESNESQ